VAVVNGSRDSLTFDGMADAEVERRMKVCSLPAPVLTSYLLYEFVKSSQIIRSRTIGCTYLTPIDNRHSVTLLNLLLTPQRLCRWLC
jgi:hypothetical protein